MHKYRFILTDPVGAVGCLVFHRRVPPPRKVDDMGRRGQRQSGACGPRAEDQHIEAAIIRLQVALEPVDDLLSLRNGRVAIDDVDPLEAEDTGSDFNLLEAGVVTFAALLDRAVERDMRRTITWNRFLAQRPDAALEARNALRRKTAAEREKKRIVPIYRIAPSSPTLGASEFDGRFENGRLAFSVRDALRQGVLDLKGKPIWRATLQPTPTKSDKIK